MREKSVLVMAWEGVNNLSTLIEPWTKKFDILDHYRTYALLDKLLHTPTKLASQQLAFQIEPQTSQMLIEMYYEFDDVIRELLRKKIISKSRKDMDEMAKKTGITLKSCRREYDNVKRVFKIVQDLPGSFATNIKQHFLLSDDLANYAIFFIKSIAHVIAQANK